MSILAPSVANLWKIIESYGMDPKPLFEEEGLEVSLPIEPGTRVPYVSVDRVRAKAAKLSGDEAFGLRSAEFFHPTQLGALGYAWLASSSLRTAFMRLHRYIRVLNDKVAFGIEDHDGLVSTRGLTDVDSVNRPVRDDARMAIMLTLVRMNLGKDYSPVGIWMMRQKPEDDGPWQSFFRCPIEYGMERNRQTYRREDVDRVLPSGNPVLAQMNERVVTRRLAQLDLNDIPNRVRAAIMEQLPSGNLSDETVAEELHMTSRTLHRRLKQDGQSFRGLLNEVRQDLAAQYISDPSLTLTEITFLLGFAEASSFSRAFRRWTGTSPTEARHSSQDD